MLIGPDNEFDLGEVRLNANLEQILADDQWIDDATGLVPHCLSILKTCRFLTESLTALTIADMRTKSGLTQIVEVYLISPLGTFTYYAMVSSHVFSTLPLYYHVLPCSTKTPHSPC